MGAGNVQISLLVTVHIVFIIIGSLIASRHAWLVKGRGMLITSFVLMAAGIGLAALAPSLKWIFAAQVIHGYSIGLSYPVLMGLAIENVLQMSVPLHWDCINPSMRSGYSQVPG